MNPLAIFKCTGDVTAVPRLLEEVIEELTRYGRPRLYCSSDMLWSCVVEMNTIATGAEFNIRSDHKHPSPMAAALQCRERVLAAIGTTAQTP